MKDTHDRMPLILETKDVEQWLQEDSKVEEFLNKEPMQLMKQMEYEQQRLFI